MESRIHTQGEELKTEDKENTLNKLEKHNQALVEELVRASSMIRDMEGKYYQAARRQMIGKVMAGGLLHDLRNPLTIISSCAQFCIENDGLSSIIEEKLQMILENVRKANELAKQFLEYTRTSFLDYRSVDINQTILAVWKLSELESAPCQVVFEPDLDKNLPQVIGSQENLERVFLNLFINAIQTVSKRGKVRAQTRLSPGKGSVEIRITDNGPGIPKEKLNRIFEPFYTTKTEGTGLGLSICQSLILQHNGKIHFESETGHGTTAVIMLPLCQE